MLHNGLNFIIWVLWGPRDIGPLGLSVIRKKENRNEKQEEHFRRSTIWETLLPAHVSTTPSKTPRVQQKPSHPRVFRRLKRDQIIARKEEQWQFRRFQSSNMAVLLQVVFLSCLANIGHVSSDNSCQTTNWEGHVITKCISFCNISVH